MERANIVMQMDRSKRDSGKVDIELTHLKGTQDSADKLLGFRNNTEIFEKTRLS